MKEDIKAKLDFISLQLGKKKLFTRIDIIGNEPDYINLDFVRELYPDGEKILVRFSDNRKRVYYRKNSPEVLTEEDGIPKINTQDFLVIEDRVFNKILKIVNSLSE